MTSDCFQKQMTRLADVFPKTYSQERLKLIFAQVRHHSDGVFERAITRLISTRRVAPLLNEFNEALEEVTAEDKQRAREYAGNQGVLEQLQQAQALNRGSADPEFVKACLKHLREFLDRKISKSQFDEGCRMLDVAASELMKKGRPS